MSENLPLEFPTAVDFCLWLAENACRSDGIWLRIYKKSSEKGSVSYAEALDEALCFGWIDGHKKPLDSDSWLQRFTPRRSKGNWSKRNTEHAERLIASGRMTDAGLREIERAKADGRWEAAYDAFGSAQLPEDFLKAVAGNAKASAFLATLNRTNIYSIVYRLQTAKKAETREARMNQIIGMLERGEKFH